MTLLWAIQPGLLEGCKHFIDIGKIYANEILLHSPVTS
jgi:hypothetical protein